MTSPGVPSPTPVLATGIFGVGLKAAVTTGPSVLSVAEGRTTLRVALVGAVASKADSEEATDDCLMRAT